MRDANLTKAAKGAGIALKQLRKARGLPKHDRTSVPADTTTTAEPGTPTHGYSAQASAVAAQLALQEPEIVGRLKVAGVSVDRLVWAILEIAKPRA